MKLKRGNSPAKILPADENSQGVIFVDEVPWVFDFKVTATINVEQLLLEAMYYKQNHPVGLIPIADSEAKYAIELLITAYKIPGDLIEVVNLKGHLNVRKLKNNYYAVHWPFHIFDKIGIEEAKQFFMITTAYALYFGKPLYESFEEYNPFEIIQMANNNGIFVSSGGYKVPFFYTEEQGKHTIKNSR